MSKTQDQPSECLHINLFGGPGISKSTTATGLFSKMKRNNLKVEYVSEIAKELVYSKDFFSLGDQLMILARQHHSWYKLNNQVDYTVNDGAFLLSLIYVQENKHLPLEYFKPLIVEMFKSYKTLNILLERSDEHPYQEYGRNETLDEALALDEKIKSMLIENNIPFVTIKVGKKTIKQVFKLVKENK